METAWQLRVVLSFWRRRSTLNLLLHIGTQKTGTTLLQQWLYGNRAALSRQGVYLAKKLGRPNNRILVSYVGERLDSRDRGLGIRTMAEKRDSLRGFENEFRAEVETAARSHQYMIICSEHFHSDLRRASELQHLREILFSIFESVSVIVYFREPASLRKSVYSTSLRNGGTAELSEYSVNISPKSYFYNALAAANLWSGVFGLENFLPSVYDRTQFRDGDIRRDFLAKIPSQIDDRALDFSLKTVNERISQLQATALTCVNRLLPFWPGDHSWREANLSLKEKFLSSPVFDVGEISDVHGRDISRRFDEVNSEFFARYLPGSSFPPYQGAAEKEETLSLGAVSDTLSAGLEETIQVMMKRGIDDGEAQRLAEIARHLRRQGRLSDAQFVLGLAFRTNSRDVLVNRELTEISRYLDNQRSSKDA